MPGLPCIDYMTRFVYSIELTAMVFLWYELAFNPIDLTAAIGFAILPALVKYRTELCYFYGSVAVVILCRLCCGYRVYLMASRLSGEILDVYLEGNSKTENTFDEEAFQREVDREAKFMLYRNNKDMQTINESMGETDRKMTRFDDLYYPESDVDQKEYSIGQSLSTDSRFFRRKNDNDATAGDGYYDLKDGKHKIHISESLRLR